jgi:hypothetical protein
MPWLETLYIRTYGPLQESDFWSMALTQSAPPGLRRASRAPILLKRDRDGVLGLGLGAAAIDGGAIAASWYPSTGTDMAIPAITPTGTPVHGVAYAYPSRG